MSPESENPHLLIIDDDERLRSLLSKYLKEHHFQVSTASSAPDARQILKSLQFSLLIVDVMMPEETGLEFTKNLREEGTQIPILLLTARGEVEDRILGLESGADDYLPKPFEPKELLLRIQGLLKRARQTAPTFMKEDVQIGPFHFNKSKGQLRKGTEIIVLTQAEAELLKIFVHNIGQYLSREFLSETLNLHGNSRTIDVQITRLRKKIEDDSKNPKLLQTIRNKGYVLWGY
ncbi:MAG: response regulator transcription factor [Alphaproteobacteria bacterium]